MELLREITEQELDVHRGGSSRRVHKVRDSARAVLLRDGKIALMHVKKQHYHKLPGGGVEGKESLEDCLRREVLEEAGSQINILGEIGIIKEDMTRWNLVRISYSYIAESTGKLRANNLTDSEKSNEFSLKWVPIQEAMRLIKQDKPLDYEGKFIQVRDLTILQKADEILNHSRC